MFVTVFHLGSSPATRQSRAACILALLLLMPGFAGCASAAEPDDSFILPPPPDHDGPNVKAQPVPGVELRPLESSAAEPPAPSGTTGPAAPRDSVTVITAHSEQIVWRRALASDNPELTKVYLLRYPAGRHVADAKDRFRDLLVALGERRRLEWRQRQG